MTLRKRLNSFKYAFRGLGLLFITQANARIHLFVLIAVVVAGKVLEVSTTEWLFLVSAIGAVLTAEALNTALEFLTDLVSPGYHELAGKAKDVAAAAVLITALTAACTGLIIFLPKLLRVFQVS